MDTVPAVTHLSEGTALTTDSADKTPTTTLESFITLNHMLVAFYISKMKLAKFRQSSPFQ
jgi:hypothetical protein